MTHKFYDFWHLHLGKDTSTYIISEVCYVTNGERVRPLYGDLAWFTSIELLHTLYFGESNEVAIFEAMTGLIQACHKAIVVLKHAIKAMRQQIGKYRRPSRLIRSFQTEAVLR